MLLKYNSRRSFQHQSRRCVSVKSHKSWLGILGCLSYPLILAHEASQISTRGILRMAGRQPGPGPLSSIFDITATCFILYHSILVPFILIAKLMYSRLLQNQATDGDPQISHASSSLALSLFFLMTFKTNKLRWPLSLLLRMLLLLLLNTLSSTYISLIPFVIAGSFGEASRRSQ